MIGIYYNIAFFLSALLCVFYVFRWKRHFDVNITILFALVPISNMGQVLLYLSDNLGQAVYANIIMYTGGIFLPFFITFSILSLCKIKTPFWIGGLCFLWNMLMFMSLLSTERNGYFYRKVDLDLSGPHPVFIKEYGPVHTIFYITIAIYLFVGIVTILYTFFRRKQVSRVTVFLLFFPEAFTVLGFFLGRIVHSEVEFLPMAYTLALIIYFFIVERMSLYRTSNLVIDSFVEKGEDGFVTFDRRYHYLGSNETAKSIFPVLRELSVDQDVKDREEMKHTLLHWIRLFEENEKYTNNLYVKKDPQDEEKDKMYSVRVDHLYNGRRKVGYQVFLVDDTQDQKYIRLLDRYNTELEDEVDRKTKKVVEMHNNLVLSMATMVESRDNSTGGHIKRTSIGVKILTDEMRRKNKLHLSDEFYNNLIKAAPMHDLGKIAVDDAVLRKPGRFTPEEYDEMKKHASEGARIVHDILKDTDDREFRILAENVAHFHHERVDGSGYPDGRKKKDIPIEARIMAIADVYDALVSKRVYKERMSFEEADAIIMEGMGKHFDEDLKEYYVAARPKLEEYYRSLDGE